ncbi:histidinol-phosphatase [Desulfatiferula olefinivorans]
MIDYHIHTPLCNHAQGSMRQSVLHAVSAGLSEICFLDHLIIDGPGLKNTMAVSEVPLYVQAAAALRREFEGKIIIRTGLEVDFIPERIDEISRIIESFDFDVIGASVHFVRGYNVASRRNAPPEGLFADGDMARLYVEALDRMLDYDFFDVVCHPDVVRKSGIATSQDVEPLMEGLLEKIARKGLTLEFNTGGWDHPAEDSYPSRPFAEKCHLRGIPFTLGSDAHRPENVGRNIDRGAAILKRIGYTHINTFERRQVRPVPLWG